MNPETQVAEQEEKKKKKTGAPFSPCGSFRLGAGLRKIKDFGHGGLKTDRLCMILTAA